MRSKSEEKRLQILNAAMKMFVEKGFSSVSMDQIAAEAGVSKQTVYSHFGGKEGLFCSAVGEKCHLHMAEEELFQDDAAMDCRQRLYLVAERFAALILSQEALCVYRTCVAHSDEQPGLSQLYYESGPQRLISQLKSYLIKEAERGVLKLDNPHHAAVQLLMMCKTEELIRMELGLPRQLNDEQLHGYLHDCVDRFLLGYGYRPEVDPGHKSVSQAG